MQNYLFIDVETIPDQNIPEKLKPAFNPDSVKLGNVKDPERVKAKIISAGIEFETGLTKKMSVSSDLCQIISLGYIETDPQFKEISRGVFFNETSDKEILVKFQGVLKDSILVGWNLKGFDNPVIWKRGIIQGLNIFNDYLGLNNKYRSERCIDLMHVWNNFDMGKMSACADRLGIENKTGMDGSMIYQAFQNKQFQEIQDYNLQDCQVCLEIAKKVLK
jgi:predicted PolB exonuclease-like 3'-5' exonuclease